MQKFLAAMDCFTIQATGGNSLSLTNAAVANCAANDGRTGMGSERQVTVTLEADLDAFVRGEVHRGDFSSDNDYIVELLRERYDLDRLLKKASLDQALREGINDVEQGRAFAADEAFGVLRKELGLGKGD